MGFLLPEGFVFLMASKGAKNQSILAKNDLLPT